MAQTIHFPHARINEIGYPHLSLWNPETQESEYVGRNINEFFKKYKVEFFLNCEMKYHEDMGSWTNLGKVAAYAPNGKFPQINFEFIFGDD